MGFDHDDDEPSMKQLWAQTGLGNSLETRATALRTIALRLAAKGEYFKAISAAQTAGTLFDEMGETEEVAQSHFFVGLQYMEMARPKDAQPEFRNAIDNFVAIGNTAGQAEATRQLGFAHKFSEEFNEAIDAWHRAIPLLEEEGEYILAGISILEIGERQVANTQYEIAIETFERALQHFKDSNDLIGVGRAKNLIGNAYVSLGRPLEALEWLDGARETFKYIEDNHRRMSAEFDLACGFEAAGFTDEAITNFEAVGASFKKANHHEQHGDCLVHLSKLNRDRGETGKANEQEKTARLVFDGCGARQKVRSVDISSAIRMADAGDEFDAEELLSAIIVSASGESESVDLREVKIRLSEIYTRWQQPDRALQVLSEDAELTEASSFAQKIRWHNAYAASLIGVARVDEARPHLERSLSFDMTELAPQETGRAYELLAMTMVGLQEPERDKILGQATAYYLKANDLAGAKRVAQLILPASPHNALCLLREADGQLPFFNDASSSA